MRIGDFSLSAHCPLTGWIYNIDEQVHNLGATIVFSFMATMFGSTCICCGLWVGIADKRTALISGFVTFLTTFALGLGFVCHLMRRRMREHGLWSWRSMFYGLLFRNVIDLRDDLAGVVGYIPVAWAVLIKFFIPPILLVLFSLGCAAKTDAGETEFGRYGGYPALPYQVLGISTVVFVGFLFVSSLVAPQLYDAFQKPDLPVPSKDVAIHAAPMEQVTRDKGDDVIRANSVAERPVWPPRSISIGV